MNLDRALEIAVKAHSGQIDKIAEPYILHPLRVLLRMGSDEERIVAVLHDVVEDSPVTLDDLKRAGFPAAVIEAVDLLTRRKGEDYEVYVERAAANPLARTIKIADLEDNMDLRRRHGLSDPPRMARYQKAYRFLTGHEFS